MPSPRHDDRHQVRICLSRGSGWVVPAFLLTLLLAMPRPSSAATISAKAVSVSLTAADFGLASTQPHAGYSATSTLDGGDVSGTSMSLTEGTSTITKTNLLFWTYSDTNSKRTVTAAYTITNPTLTITGVPSSTSKVVISSITTSSVSYSSSTKLYSGYASMTMDLSNATRSGTYRTTGTTVTITVTII
jgi:hypothetical protein